MAENKTKYTNESVEDYLASRASDSQRRDCEQLMAMFARITGQTPRMWGPSIVGYGDTSYRCDSGRTSDVPMAAFAIRGRELVVYLSCEGEKQKSLLDKAGKHKMGKSCFHFKRLADIDQEVLEQLVVGAIAEVAAQHG